MMKTNKIRKFLCTGFGVAQGYEYEVEAVSHNAARLQAAQLFKKEDVRLEPLDFLKSFFGARVLDPKKPGPQSSLLVQVRGGLQ